MRQRAKKRLRSMMSTFWITHPTVTHPAILHQLLLRKLRSLFLRNNVLGLHILAYLSQRQYPAGHRWRVSYLRVDSCSHDRRRVTEWCPPAHIVWTPERAPVWL